MADLLTEITAYLATAASLVVGTTLFRSGFPPDGTATVSAIIPTGGVARGNVPLRDATYQVITRGMSLAECLIQADKIYGAALDTLKLPKSEASLSTLKAKRIEPLQPPASIGLDAAGRIRTSFNLRVLATE